MSLAGSHISCHEEELGWAGESLYSEVLKASMVMVTSGDPPMDRMTDRHEKTLPSRNFDGGSSGSMGGAEGAMPPPALYK